MMTNQKYLRSQCADVSENKSLIEMELGTVDISR
jgi:hypothetical protein